MLHRAGDYRPNPDVRKSEPHPHRLPTGRHVGRERHARNFSGRRIQQGRCDHHKRHRFTKIWADRTRLGQAHARRAGAIPKCSIPGQRTGDHRFVTVWLTSLGQAEKTVIKTLLATRASLKKSGPRRFGVGLQVPR